MEECDHDWFGTLGQQLFWISKNINFSSCTFLVTNSPNTGESKKISECLHLYASSVIPVHQVKNKCKLNLFFTHQVNRFDISGRPVSLNYSNVSILYYKKKISTHTWPLSLIIGYKSLAYFGLLWRPWRR